MSINPYESPSESTSPGLEPDADDAVLRFEVQIEDVKAFQQYYYRHSRAMRKRRYISMAIWGFAFFAMNYLLFREMHWFLQLTFTIALTTIATTFYVILNKWSYFYQSRNNLRNMDLSALICDHELRQEDEFLIEVTTVNVSRHAYDKLHSVEESPNHAFIFMSPLQAHVIPKQRITQGDLTRFLPLLRERIEAAKG
ncbi:MAG: YcxB family protein [Pirellulaceae bacterium]